MEESDNVPINYIFSHSFALIRPRPFECCGPPIIGRMNIFKFDENFCQLQNLTSSESIFDVCRSLFVFFRMSLVIVFEVILRMICKDFQVHSISK